MSIQTVAQLCAISDIVKTDGLVDQIANVEDVHTGKIDPDAFFRRNHFTEGLTTLVRNGFDRLSGRSETGAFYLSQSMGGGKTHALIAFALLAQDDGLRHRIIPAIAPTADFGSAKVVIFNGHQNPANFLWGTIAERLGRPETMARFWKDGAKAPGVDDWKAALGDEPVLILLDELPSYLQLAEGHAVGNSTVADITIGALERLFNALTQLPRACVVVTNLLDDVFAEGSEKLKTLINTLNKQYGKYAQAITPVQQNSGEVFQIIRKKLFDKLPDDSVIENIAQAYVDELNKAKKIDDVPVVPESYIARIRETYPFHPSIRDVVARFKENAGYQQTRALIRILRYAVRNVFNSSDQIFLVGLQHLDFNTQGVVEEIRKVNPSFTNAISKDVADRGNAIAEGLDAELGSPTTTALAKLILMSSLSTAQDPVLGLRRNEVVEFLIDPLTKTASITSALEKFVGLAEYLFTSPDQRIFFGPTANVTSEVNNTAASLAEEVVDQELREKLGEIFRPRAKALYRNVEVLPSLDTIKVSEDDVTLLVVERPPNELPQELKDWWQNLDRQNRVLFVTADPIALSTLRAVARQIKAISIVSKAVATRHAPDSTQARDIDKLRTQSAARFTSAARETFSSLVFPTEHSLRSYDQFRMEFKDNDYNGEEQILQTLEQRGKYYPSAKIAKDIATLRMEAEAELFDADGVQRTELKRKAAAKPGWYWLEAGGLDNLIDECIRTKHWRLHGGLIEKKFTRETSLAVRLDGPIEPMIASGVYKLIVSPQDADTIFASETGDPNPAKSGKVISQTWETSAPKVSFIAVDSKHEAQTGQVHNWEAPIHIAHEVRSTSNGFEIGWQVLPRSAEVRVSLDGIDPKSKPAATSPFLAPADCDRALLIATVGGRFGDQVKVPLIREGESVRVVEKVRDDRPLVLKERQKFDSITKLTDAIAALQSAPGSTVKGGRIEIATDAPDQFVDITFGSHVTMDAEHLNALINAAGEAAGMTVTKASAAFSAVSFATGKDYRVYADAMKLDFEAMSWSQDD